MSKLGVLIVHGMGNQPSDFAEDMIRELRSRLQDLGSTPGDVRWKASHWGQRSRLKYLDIAPSYSPRTPCGEHMIACRIQARRLPPSCANSVMSLPSGT